jgi:HSP20 family protein
MALVRRERHWDWPELFGWPFGEEGRGLAERLFGWKEDVLRVEAYEEGDELVIRAEMPGIDPAKDVDISVADGLLTIKAERREENKQEDKAGYRSEFRYGMFRRSVELPAGVKEDDIKASYVDGILEVRVPAAEPAAPAVRKIPVSYG